MNENSQVESVVEDANIFTQFINLTCDISKALYLARHPEENDESPRPIVIRKQKLSRRLRQVAA